MSRNLGQSTCGRCGGNVVLVGLPAPITEAQAKGYYADHEGMVVADARCPECGALYLAWLDGSRRRGAGKYPERVLVDGHMVPTDLSYRSTFNDEPGAEDLPGGLPGDLPGNLPAPIDP